MVTSKERDYMYRMYAADPRARINLGIRRRLAPLMENDTDRIKLMNSLLLSMPGSPIIYYGDEIGMGDNIFLGDRDGVRTPMQWTPDRNAGFSRADPQRLYLPPIMDPIYGYEAVNVEAQLREPSSLLNWMKRMLAVRKQSQAFGRGRLTFLNPGNNKVLAYLRELGDEAVLCVANVGRSAQPVELDLKRYRGRVPVEMLGRVAFPPIGELPYLLTLPAHAFYWFRLATDVEAPDWHESFTAREELPVIVLFDGWSSFFRDRVVPWRIGMAQKVRDQFELEILPRYIEQRRWFAQKGEKVKRARLVDHGLLERGSQSWLIGQFDVETGAQTIRYFVPLSLAWEETEEARVRSLKTGTVAKVRQQANVGVMADALPDVAFCRALVETIGQGRELATAQGKLRFVPTRAFREIAGSDLSRLDLARPTMQSSNTVVTLGDRLFVTRWRSSRTACASPGRSSISPPTARPPRCACCRRSSPTKATAGPTPSTTWAASSKSAVRSRRRRMRTAASSPSCRHSARAPRNCIAHSPAPPAMQRSIPSLLPQPISPSGSDACSTRPPPPSHCSTSDEASCLAPCVRKRNRCCRDASV